MKKIKVYLQRPWKFSDSPYYSYLIKDVSRNIKYVNTEEKSQDIVKSLGQFKGLNKLKRVIKLTLRNFFPFLPNAHLTKTSKKYDLVHCAHCLSLNKKLWICDIEYVNQFWAGGITKKQRKLILKLLKSEYCKKILAWTEWTKKEILKIFPEIEDKIEVIYPAIKIQKFKKNKDNKIRLLFISRRFYFKGGLHAVEVMDRITRKHKNVEALIISDTPKKVIEKYSQNKKIKFKELTPREKILSEIYPKTDILVYPSYTDTFGFILLEAMSFGIPIITVEGQSREDLVRDGKNGFVVKEPKNWKLSDLEKTNLKTVKEMEVKTEKLIKNKRLRNKMSENSLEEFKTGRFSIEKRNKNLERIYFDALKKEEPK